jgi:hypothetical protein
VIYIAIFGIRNFEQMSKLVQTLLALINSFVGEKSAVDHDQVIITPL